MKTENTNIETKKAEIKKYFILLAILCALLAIMCIGVFLISFKETEVWLVILRALTVVCLLFGTFLFTFLAKRKDK